MEVSWESRFINNAKVLGHSDEYIDACLKYALELKRRNLPIIFSVDHLLQLCGAPFSAGKSFFDLYYKEYEIKKRSGGNRKISAPNSNLKYCQNWILENVLNPLATELGSEVNGFVKKKSIITNAAPHIGSKWIINIDIKNFFNSIRRDKVEEFFHSLGYEDDVATMLANVCTKYERGFGCVLPQGSPCSPMLSNLMVTALDKDLKDWAQMVNAKYTRYADDITFSSSDIFPTNAIKQIYSIIRHHGFFPNKQKTKIKGQGNRMMVTGLTINNGVHVPKDYRRKIWTDLYFLKKYGVSSYRFPENVKKSYLAEWLFGKIMFVRSVDRKTGDKMLKSFKEINWII